MSVKRNLRSELEYGALIAYVLKDPLHLVLRSKDVIYRMKHDAALASDPGTKMVDFFARKLSAVLPITPFEVLFRNQPVLVPVPRSVPTGRAVYWPALALATAMHRQGFGTGVHALLKRERPIPASSQSKDKPSLAQHESSLSTEPLLIPDGTPFLLVDDVVTSGTDLRSGPQRAQPSLSTTVEHPRQR